MSGGVAGKDLRVPVSDTLFCTRSKSNKVHRSPATWQELAQGKSKSSKSSPWAYGGSGRWSELSWTSRGVSTAQLEKTLAIASANLAAQWIWSIGSGNGTV